MIKLAREVGNHQILNYFTQDYYSNLKKILASEEDISTELAIELVKIAGEKGDWDVLHHVERHLSRRLQKHRDVSTEFVIEVIKLADKADDPKILAQFLELYMHDILKRERRIPVVVVVELLKLAHEVDSQEFSANLETYLEIVVEHQSYVQPELASEMLKFACKIQNRKILDYFSKNYLTNMLHDEKPVSIELAVELIKLAQESGTHDQASVERFYRKHINVERLYVGLLPLDTIIGIRRLARAFHDDELLKKIEQRLEL